MIVLRAVFGFDRIFFGFSVLDNFSTVLRFVIGHNAPLTSFFC